MAKGKRALVATGVEFLFECAIREDYTSPAERFLE